MSDMSIVSANRLLDGVAVWLTADGGWTTAAEDAAVFDPAALADAEAGAREAEARNQVVGVQVEPAVVAETGARPGTLRERIRASGPTVLPLEAMGARADPTLPTSPSGDPGAFAGIYRYDDYDRAFLKARAEVFRDQVARRLRGELSEDEFKPLRLMNGLYLQLHAYMLRVAIPYGVMSSRQMRQLAEVARRYDRGYGHFTTRQNIQFNWIRLQDAPDILSLLAEADLHAIQTSGNCIRNVTTDHFAGAARDEVVDPRLYAEILRQWSTEHPEFSFLPRKFKIAITGSPVDRAAVRFHDIGVLARRGPGGQVGFTVYAGGGLGRTPIVGVKVREWLPEPDFLRFMEAILRVYNCLGRRDNIYKARIKILIRELGAEAFTQMIEDEFAAVCEEHPALDPAVVAAIDARFPRPPFEPPGSVGVGEGRDAAPGYQLWRRSNVHAHRQPGYASATISLKATGQIPGDLSAEGMDRVAELAERFSFGEIRVSHEQNLVLPHVPRAELPVLWAELERHGLATPNAGLVTDIIACPGLDYCALAVARSIPVAQRISERYASMALQHDIGEVHLNISGCINACGHHHIGHIGLLGVDKAGEEYYQITLGGASDDQPKAGTIIGPAVSSAKVVDAIEAILEAYRRQRLAGERFIDTVRRLGTAPFKEAVYGSA